MECLTSRLRERERERAWSQSRWAKATVRSARQASSSNEGGTPSAIVAGDFNGDGKIDLAVTDSSENLVMIYLEQRGRHVQHRRVKAFIPPTRRWITIVSVDFNRDGIVDLAVASLLKEGTINILQGNGDGTFAYKMQTFVFSGDGPVAMVTGDFNGDGVADLAIVNSGDDNVTIFLGNGDGTFVPSDSKPSTGEQPQAVAIGDFNGDGKLDLATANAGDNTVTILLGAGDGTFTPSTHRPRRQQRIRYRLRQPISMKTAISIWLWPSPMAR